MTKVEKQSFALHVAITSARAAELGAVIHVKGFALRPEVAARWALLRTLCDLSERGAPQDVRAWPIVLLESCPSPRDDVELGAGELVIARMPGAFCDALPVVVERVGADGTIFGAYFVAGRTAMVPLILRPGQYERAGQIVNGVPLPAGPECLVCSHEPCFCCVRGDSASCDTWDEEAETTCGCMDVDCTHPPGAVARWAASCERTIDAANGAQGATCCRFCQQLEGFDAGLHTHCEADWIRTEARVSEVMARVNAIARAGER